MPKFIIEREISGVGDSTSEQLADISRKSCGVLNEMDRGIQWIQSYVTPDKIYCVYLAKDEQQLLDHATQGGFPANTIARVKEIIEPVTAE
ncbi:MAG: DUF4242 domain-containing protein [Gemmatimonadaceae bacterium]